jgi:hypothetical protein
MSSSKVRINLIKKQKLQKPWTSENESKIVHLKFSFEYADPFAANVLRLPDGFYFGHSWHCRFVKNIAIKIEKLLTEIYIAIFFLQEV